jgi:hypothetical protein
MAEIDPGLRREDEEHKALSARFSPLTLPPRGSLPLPARGARAGVRGVFGHASAAKIAEFAVQLEIGRDDLAFHPAEPRLEICEFAL